MTSSRARYGYAAGFAGLTAFTLFLLGNCLGPDDTEDRALEEPASYRELDRLADSVGRELDAVSQALKVYHVQYGVYPPNSSDAREFAAHWNDRFPQSEDPPPEDIDAAEAVVFWLGGFSEDPQHPLTGLGGPRSDSAQRPHALFDFYTDRLKLNARGRPVYQAEDSSQPYVYFNTTSRRRLEYPADAPLVQPYRTDDDTYVNADSFQLLSAGPDGEWGDLPAPHFPDGPFTNGHADNRVNFTPRVLGAMKYYSSP